MFEAWHAGTQAEFLLAGDTRAGRLHADVAAVGALNNHGGLVQYSVTEAPVSDESCSAEPKGINGTECIHIDSDYRRSFQFPEI
jgi:hypothetical protein